MPLHQHAHAYPEAMIALEGRTVYGVNGQAYPCGPGSVFVFEPDVPHDEGYPEWTPATTHLWIAFIQNKAMARLIDGRGGRIRVRGNIPGLFAPHDSALWQEGASPGAPGRPPELARLRRLAALAEVVADLVEAGYGESKAGQRRHFQREKIEAICRHIQDTGGRDAELSHLAHIAGFSKYHFLRLFKAHTGQSVHTTVTQARRLRVEELLARGLAKKAIAAELGFSCPAAFSRWYRPFRARKGL